jgi:hypothetical protein
MTPGGGVAAQPRSDRTPAPPDGARRSRKSGGEDSESTGCLSGFRLEIREDPFE